MRAMVAAFLPRVAGLTEKQSPYVRAMKTSREVSPPARESRVRGSGVEAEHVVEAADHHSAGVIEVAVAVLRPRDEGLELALLVPLARLHAGRIQQGLGGFHERVGGVSLRVSACHWDGSLCSGKKAESYYGDDPYTILGLS